MCPFIIILDVCICSKIFFNSIYINRGFMNLSKGKINEKHVIERILIDNITKTRLQVLGVLKGTKIEILNKRLNGSIIIKVRGTRLGIDKEISNSIFVGERSAVSS